MKLTPNYSLPEPEDNDFGNGALQLQAFAEAADTDITALQDSLYNNQFTSAWIGTSTSDVTSLSSFLPFNTNTSVLSFGAFTTTYARGFTLGSVLNSPTTLPEAGIYLFGAYANLQATGTVNANTMRAINVGASVPSGPQFTSQRQYVYTDTTQEANIGVGMFLTAMGQFEYQPVTLNRPVGFWFGYQYVNPSSTVSVKAGAIFWVIKISDLGG